MEANEIFTHAGGQTYHAIPCLNDNSTWIDGLEAIALENLQGWDLQLTTDAVLAQRAENVRKVSQA